MSAWRTLHSATLELAKGTPLKQRLAVAFSKHLNALETAELPPALRSEFEAMLQAFELVTPMRGESAVHATVRKMSAEDADRMAARIVTLFGHVARASSPRAVEDVAPSLEEGFDFVIGEDSAEVLPLFAAKA